MKAKQIGRLCGKLAITAMTLVAGVEKLVAQEQNPRDTTMHFGAEICPNIGQGTNIVLMQKVNWSDSSGLGYQTRIFFSPTAKQAILVLSSNGVCFLNGKIYSVAPGMQSFIIATSQPFEANDFTEGTAANILYQNQAQTKKFQNEISVKPLLGPENNAGYSNPLFLRKVTLRANNGYLEVDFESFLHITGKVILDREINPIYMALNPTNQSLPLVRRTRFPELKSNVKETNAVQ